VNPISQALLDECCRQSENCRYTAISFNIWLRRLRLRRTASLIFPVIFGALATAGIVTQHYPALAAVFALLATTIPLVYRSSKTDRSISQFTRLAGEFTNLRDRFRQLGDIGIHKEVTLFEGEFRTLMARMEKARKFAETPPEWCFLKAREKEKSGHMRHDYDEQKESLGIPGA
jgi:hypothetical protein